MEKQFSTYSVIPTKIMLDKNISSTAKILYGIISSLCNEKGFCWASNEYLGNLLGISATSISLIIKELVKNKYIESTIKDKFQRQITIMGVLRKLKGGIKKTERGVLRKLKDNNIIEYNKFNNEQIKKYKDGTILKLNDGTNAVKRFGIWVLLDNPSVKIDKSFYKELN